MNKSRAPLIGMCVLTLAGCASVQEHIQVIGERHRVRNEGYSLLYTLVSKQQDVDGILKLKHASREIAAEIKEIAAVFRQAHQQLDAFGKSDPGLHFQMEHLPTLEIKTRASIEGTTTKRLLFSTGKNFELELLFTQRQALDYASHLARQLSDRDDDKKRKAFLTQLSEHCEQHQQKVVRLLSSL